MTFSSSIDSITLKTYLLGDIRANIMLLGVLRLMTLARHHRLLQMNNLRLMSCLVHVLLTHRHLIVGSL